MWRTCHFKKFDVNCCETVNVRPYLSENEILIYYNVVGNRKAFLLSSNLQRITEVHKTLTQICICGTVSLVAVSASLTDDGNLSHFNLKSHNYSVPLRWILPTLYCKQNVLFVGIKQNGNLQGICFLLYQYSTLKFWLEFQKSGYIQCTWLVCKYLTVCIPYVLYNTTVHEVITSGRSVQLLYSW